MFGHVLRTEWNKKNIKGRIIRIPNAGDKNETEL